MHAGAGGYTRCRIGLASLQDEVDRPGAHGVNSLSGLRGYGGGASTSPGAPGSNDYGPVISD